MDLYAFSARLAKLKFIQIHGEGYPPPLYGVFVMDCVSPHEL